MRSRALGFSLLEVMVAIAILGLALTVILSAQGGLAASNKSAANVGMSTSLARCKMTEVEEKLLKFGYPEIEQIDTDVPCCDIGDTPGFICDTRVEKIVLPQPPNPADISADGGSFSALGAASGGFGALASASTPEGAAGALSQLAGAGSSSPIDLDGGLASVGNQITQQLAGVGGTQGLLTMVMGFVYPSVKIMMEASIRRLTVTVHWKEGTTPKDFTIVQYVTNPSNGGFQAGVAGSVTGTSTSATGALPAGAAPTGTSVLGTLKAGTL